MRNRILTAALLAAAMPITANAGMLEAGEYKISDYNHRSVWTAGYASQGMIEGVKRWSFLEDAIFNYDPEAAGPKAVLTATAEATNNPNLFLDFQIEFDVTDEATPYCEGSYRISGTNKCNDSTPFDVNDWSFFKLASGTASGTGILEGIVFDLTSKPAHNPQAGIGANAKDDDELGFSMWFDWALAAGSATMSTDNQYWTTASGHGDINSDLELEPVPLPAAGWMLIAGLGGLAAAGRRKKA